MKQTFELGFRSCADKMDAVFYGSISKKNLEDAFLKIKTKICKHCDKDISLSGNGAWRHNGSYFITCQQQKATPK